MRTCPTCRLPMLPGEDRAAHDANGCANVWSALGGYLTGESEAMPDMRQPVSDTVQTDDVRCAACGIACFRVAGSAPCVVYVTGTGWMRVDVNPDDYREDIEREAAVQRWATSVTHYPASGGGDHEIEP